MSLKLLFFNQWSTDILKFSNISWFPCNYWWMELPSLNGWQNNIMTLCQKSGVANCSVRKTEPWDLGCLISDSGIVLYIQLLPSWVEQNFFGLKDLLCWSTYFRLSKRIGVWGFFFATSKHSLVYYQYSMKMVSRSIPSQSTHILAPGTQITSL